ncbi:hypothetical protein BDN67DRAFT_977519 [Paxillus ammoniavirescens]|nr:hypothetical protein BDN67DRAFT_977519 [Paxillus ammoniavirescens]
MSANYLKEYEISLFIGTTLALFMYGISLCQQCYYYRAYPRDKTHQKCLVTILWGVNTFQLYCLVQQLWVYFVAGHGDLGAFQLFPWQDMVVYITMFVVPYVVQCFYASRLWIMSEKNKLITGAVFSAWRWISVSQCSVYYYLRPSRTGVRRFDAKSRCPRLQNHIQRITIVTINMGVLTCGITFAVWVTWCIQGPISPFVTFIMVMSQSYVNSLMAV